MRKTNYINLGLLIFIASFLLTGHVEAQDFPIITAQQLKAKIDAGEKLLLINPLSEIEYNNKHIPGSVNIPIQTILITDKLPEDKEHLIVTYCLGRK